MEGGGRQSVSFKYTDSIQRPRALGISVRWRPTLRSPLRTKPRTGRTSTRETPGMGGGGSNRARPCISSRDLLTFNFRLLCYLWPMQKYDLAQKKQYGGWRKELEGRCHLHILI